MQWKSRIDWLSITGKVDRKDGDARPNLLHEVAELSRRMFFALGKGSPPIKTVPTARHYAVSIEDAVSGVRINFGDDLSRQGWQVVISGNACKSFDDYKILRNFVEIWKGRITRCDIAVDLVDSNYNIVEDADLYRSLTETTPKSWALLNPGRGVTWYLGSRSSDKFVRIYDKGAEQNVPVDWVRCEIEAKGGVAQYLFETYTYDYVAGIAFIREHFRLEGLQTEIFRILNKICNGEVFERLLMPKTVGDREKWMRGQVAQSFIKLSQEDPDAMERVFADWHELYLAAKFMRAIANNGE